MRIRCCKWESLCDRGALHDYKALLKSDEKIPIRSRGGTGERGGEFGPYPDTVFV